MMHEYTSSLGGLPAVTRPVTVYLYHDDWDALAPKYARLKGISTSDALAYLSTFESFAEVGTDYMVLFSANFSTNSAGLQRWTAAHELVHNYQNWNSWIVDASYDYDWSQVHLGLGPVWLFEGCVEFQVAKAFDAAGAIRYDQDREWRVSFVQNLSVPLKDIETRAEANKYPQSEYELGFLACELLSHISGKSVPSTYWTLPGTDTSWQDAFTQFFGLTIEEFYPRFERHRAAGFPLLSSEDQAEIVNVAREYTWTVDVPQGFAFMERIDNAQ